MLFRSLLKPVLLRLILALMPYKVKVSFNVCHHISLTETIMYGSLNLSLRVPSGWNVVPRYMVHHRALIRK